MKKNTSTSPLSSRQVNYGPDDDKNKMLARGKLNRLNGHTKYFSGTGMDIIYVDIMTRGNFVN